jgi:bifunctional pyridoxal-dependent enzyme with beta-cystathionase and maltose regulon repressor activities
MKRFSLGKTNGIVREALEGAFRNGEPWVKDLIHYLQGNIDLIDSMLLKSGLPVYFRRPSASYQLWLDFRKSGMEASEVHTFLSQKAKLGMNAGYWFGREGAGFTRMNIASSRSVIKEGMERLINSFPLPQ